jgi:HNH endonuclease
VTTTVVHLNGFDVDPETGLIYGPKGRPVGSRDTSGYLQIDGRTRGFGLQSAHRLVWRAANGPIPDGLVINHKNGVKTDNRIVNLELITQQGNVLHAYRTGLKSNRGDKHPSRKLGSADVRGIRRLLGEGATCRDLSLKFAVTVQTIYHIRARKTWSHLGD